MPRRTGIYRRIKMLEVECMTVDVKKEKSASEKFLIPACYRDCALRICKKFYETDDRLIVHVKSYGETRYINYFMNLFDFISKSEVLSYE